MCTLHDPHFVHTRNPNACNGDQITSVARSCIMILLNEGDTNIMGIILIAISLARPQSWPPDSVTAYQFPPCHNLERSIPPPLTVPHLFVCSWLLSLHAPKNRRVNGEFQATPFFMPSCACPHCSASLTCSCAWTMHRHAVPMWLASIGPK